MTASDEEKIKTALKLLFERDKYLLVNNSSERAIAFRLALYLCSQFEEYDVDCEYNLNIDNENKRKVIYCIEQEYLRYKKKPTRKKIKNIGGEDCLEISILPDIIIHKRGDNSRNHIIIEIKKSCNDYEVDYDRYKLQKYTEESSEFRYSTGLFLTLFVDSDFAEKADIEEFVNGEKTRNLTIASTMTTRPVTQSASLILDADCAPGSGCR